VIPFLDLKAQQAPLEPALIAAASQVIISGRYALGSRTTAFEAAFADYCGCAEAIAVSTGTAALHLALLAAGVGPGDEVITTPTTFVATVAAIEYANATPRLVDIDPLTWTMDLAKLEAAITPRTKAIVPVHLHGRLADMRAIREIARAHRLVVIEDAAQAHGAQDAEGRRAGALGDLGCFSFYPGKNLGACGEGGAVTTNRPDLADRLRLLRDWGQPRKYVHAIKGFNHRLDEMQAAMLNVKLPHLPEWTRLRRQAAARYDANLDALGIPHAAPGGNAHVYHVYAVRVPDRDAVRARLAPDVETGIHYPTPVHLQPAYADCGYRRGDFPVSEQLAAETLSLPMFPGISEAQIDAVTGALAQALRPTPHLVSETA
jgi:dTDP-4-amino-4,6-dideoxygalactose transaminase